MIKPVLEPEFSPAIVEIRKFRDLVAKSPQKSHIILAIERNDGYIYRTEFDCFADGIDDEYNFFVVERTIKSVLWVIGGFKIYISGSKSIFEKIKAAYQPDGLRAFDFDFMSTVYERKMEVVYCEEKDMPNEVKCSIPVGGKVNGKRIGLDVGGSDIKVSYVVDGAQIFSEELAWLPKLQEDINYQYEYLYSALKLAIEKLGGDCDGIGVSTAGVLVANKPMVSSIFVKVPKVDFEKVKYSYINIINKISKELGHDIPFVVANDGDVTALAGANDLKDGGVLGLAMGTSEAGGYINAEGNLNGWFSELAFMPVDFNKDAMVDEWSKDFGVGCKYFSQDAVIKLAPRAGIELDESLTLAEKLKVVQKHAGEGHKGALQIFKDIGVYLADTIAWYAEFYDIRHVLILGRVTSGIGGDLILETARATLKADFPEYKDIEIGMPSEYMRRVGQSIAAASLPDVK